MLIVYFKQLNRGNIICNDNYMVIYTRKEWMQLKSTTYNFWKIEIWLKLESVFIASWVFSYKKKTIVAVMQRGIIALKRAKTYSIAVRWLCWNDILRNSDFALIASYIIKGNHEKLITLFSTYIEKVCISSITAGELYFGAMKKKMPVWWRRLTHFVTWYRLSTGRMKQ